MAQWISLQFGMNVPWVDVFQIPQTNFDSTKNMATVGGAYFHYIAYSETFKILLLHNASMDFIIIWYECSLGGPLLDSLKNFNPTKNMAAVGGAYFHYTTDSAKF